MAYPFKLVTSGEKELRRLAGNAGTNAPLITDKLVERWRHKLPKGQKTLTLMQVQIFLREELLELLEEIRQVEKEHMEELEADIESRLQRDEDRPAVRERLIQIQGLIESTYGAGSSAKVFGPGVTTIPIDVVALVRVGLVALERLQNPKLKLGKPRYGGVAVDPKELAKGFEAPLRRLDKVLQKLADTLPRTNQSLGKKTQILTDRREQVVAGGQFLEALYRLGGRQDLADRVRLSSHPSRRRNRAGDEAGEAADTPQPETGGESSSGIPDDSADFPFAALAAGQVPGGSTPGGSTPGGSTPAPASPAATTEGRPATGAG